MLVRFLTATIILFLLTPVQADDGRQTVQLPDMMREHMLSNMRDHLLALEEITRYLANQQWQTSNMTKPPRLPKTALVCPRWIYTAHLIWANSCPKKWALLERICTGQLAGSRWRHKTPKLMGV